MTSFEVDIPDPIIFRASIADIMLIMDIANKASAMATKALATEKAEEESESRRASVAADAMTDRSSATGMMATRPPTRRTSISKGRNSAEKSRVLVSKEQVSPASDPRISS